MSKLDLDAIRVNKVREFLKGAPELDVPYTPLPYWEVYKLHEAMKRGTVQRLGLEESLTHLVSHMYVHDPIPVQTIREVILWAAFCIEGLAVNLMKLGVEPNTALDIFLEHKITNANVYPLLISGVPVEWALKIVAEREAVNDD